jgi:dTDP-4-amino-4,6-dideoxygalactose transaminase
MEFRDLKKQYQVMKPEIDSAVTDVMTNGSFIGGSIVTELEEQLADYIGVRHCISCANGTDALQLALMAWGIGKGDAVFVPDFTFFSSGEVVSAVGATPVFVDITERTFNISTDSLEIAIKRVMAETDLKPRVVVAVDLFGQPAEHEKIREIADKYNLLVLEDGAQAFGGSINGKKTCSFGDIGTTSFFPAKPFGCYGDGGAVFTDSDEWDSLIRSYKVHGKGRDKYDNVRIGMNSRLDTMQAAILKVKLKHFKEHELADVNSVANMYDEKLGVSGIVSSRIKCPLILDGYESSWAQYTILLDSEEQRNDLQIRLKENGIPAMIYYPKGLSKQKAFQNQSIAYAVTNSERISKTCISLPMGPYIEKTDVEQACMKVCCRMGH